MTYLQALVSHLEGTIQAANPGAGIADTRSRPLNGHLVCLLTVAGEDCGIPGQARQMFVEEHLRIAMVHRCVRHACGFSV